jgi:hypothetical protein
MKRGGEEMSKVEKEAVEIDRCVSCYQELAIMEQNRSVCWDCQNKISETYSDDH